MNETNYLLILASLIAVIVILLVQINQLNTSLEFWKDETDYLWKRIDEEGCPKCPSCYISPGIIEWEWEWVNLTTKDG